MKIEQAQIPIRELVKGYINNDEEGVTGYDGLLNIRPAYQREFVYDEEKKKEVIRTILRGLPLNVMYWCNSSGGKYEVLDGQQRTLSICEYINGAFSYEDKFYDNQPKDIKDKILDYELSIYICDGEESEKLEWFRIINIAGERLTEQELRNATYSGPWLTDAKRYFSKSNCVAYQIAKDYLNGKSIRQEYLETALFWIASKESKTIEQYMAEHQYDGNATQLWNYFNNVIEWTKATFKVYRKEMKGLPLGLLYNSHGHRYDLNASEIEEKIKKLMEDEDVSKKSGIYSYILTNDEKYLQIRAFDKRDIRTAYEQQEGKCAICNKEFPLDKMHADHIIPWSKGGRTLLENLQMLCRDCNLKKGAQE